jgi:hypothetical protein
MQMASDMSHDTYWSRPVADLLASLRSSPDGLATSDARQRLQH